MALVAACSASTPSSVASSADGEASALSSFPDRSATPRSACAGLAPVVNTAQDASSALAACIAATPVDGVLELPPGVYMVGTRVDLTKPMTLTTVGRAKTAACGREAAHGCAELRAMPSLVSPYGLLLAQGDGVVVDHIVLNGSRPERQAALTACHSGDPSKIPSGFNARMITCPHCAFIGSTSKLAVCGTGLEVAGVNSAISVLDSDFAFNGVHDDVNGWSDGLTVHDGDHLAVVGNRFHDNTDVDLILGGCTDCSIERNVVTHDGSYRTGAFTAIMIQAFKLTTSGRYDGSVISDNVVDCGNKEACGVGLYVGSRQWYEASRVVNGTIVGNTVINAQTGIAIGRDVTGTVIGDNDAGPTNGGARCNTIQEGMRQVHSLLVEPLSDAVFKGARVPRSAYVESLYNVGTIPNSAPGCVALSAVPQPTKQCNAPYQWVSARPDQCTPSCGQAVVDAKLVGAHQVSSPQTCEGVGSVSLESVEQFTSNLFCCGKRPVVTPPPPPPPAAPTCPTPNFSMVPNRHAGGQVQCIPSCGQAGSDAGRTGVHLAQPNRADPRVAANVAEMCNLNGLAYLFSYEEVTAGMVCCAAP